jgi:hypothetical protein
MPHSVGVTYPQSASFSILTKIKLVMKIYFVFLFCSLTALQTSGQKLELLWKSDTVLKVPESVYYDAPSGMLYVSNIDGKSNEKDGKGFISILDTNGKIRTLQWATGLDAPKGMGRYKNNLYVADLTRVAVIELNSGKVLKSVEIEGAQFLNDITVDKNGIVYISDSATGKIYKMQDNEVSLYFESKDFKRINGLLSLKKGLYVADAGSGVNYQLSTDKQLTRYTETAPGADGIVLLQNDEYLVSSWAGEVYLVDSEKRSAKILDTKDQKLNSADIDFNNKSKVLYIPTFFGNCVMAYRFTR